MRRFDLTGRKFGRVVALRPTKQKEGGRLYWWCRCDCGTEWEVRGSNLSFGTTTSCGCYQKEAAAELQAIIKTTHGHKKNGKRTPEYVVWVNMIQRCTNSKRREWKDYGGRGISVCERWRAFENFFEDMGAKPPRYTIEREDNDGNYEPNNCRWATRKEQANNRRPRS